VLWALHDSDPELRRARGSFPVTRAEAQRLNAEGFGIFWLPNPCTGQRRISNLKRIRFWICEMDEGSKKDQAARLRRSPLLPTAVVESARGYQAYWAAKDATPANFKRIVRWGIVPALRADTKACDPVRILRCPGFKHMKDPAQPFEVKTVWRLDTIYTEVQMLRAFPSREPVQRELERRELAPGEGSFWERVARLDGREALRRLDGHWLQNGERFVLQEQPSGNCNVVRADGHRCGTFIDRAGRLGNVDGGSSIGAWLYWYQRDWGTVARGLRELFPELEDGRSTSHHAGDAPG
jgi:hypothetical protein